MALQKSYSADSGKSLNSHMCASRLERAYLKQFSITTWNWNQNNKSKNGIDATLDFESQLLAAADKLCKPMDMAG